MKINFTSHGLPREVTAASEDAFLVRQRGDVVIAVLADGLGSSKDGGLAARRSVEMMADYFLSRPQAWSPRRALAEFAQQINRVLHQESLLRHASPELLCTLSVVAVERGHLYGLNVGDSPVYLWRRGVLRQLSQSHAMAEASMSHVLTRAIGLELTLEPFFFDLTLEDRDQVLLCSDGVSNALSEARLCELLARGGSARVLVASAADFWVTKPELRDDASALVLSLEQQGWEQTQESRSIEVVKELVAGSRVDGWTLVRTLQEGGRVWLAVDESGLRRVLKFFPLEASDDEERRDGFLREIWNATRIASSDFVVARVPEQGTLRYYEMEYIDAPSLKDLITLTPLKVEELVELGRFLLRAEQFLLSRDHAHGDIKPENILVLRTAEQTTFKLLDLGSAAELYSVRTRAGTASYLAPERFTGGALSERTDLYSIGVTLYEALGRALPFGEIERFQTPSFEGSPKRLTRLNPAVPPWLDAVIQKSLAVDADARYQSYSEMSYDLEHPENVPAFHRKGASLIETNPVLFYKLLCVALLVTNLFLAYRLSRR